MTREVTTPCPSPRRLVRRHSDRETGQAFLRTDHLLGRQLPEALKPNREYSYENVYVSEMPRNDRVSPRFWFWPPPLVLQAVC
jgi:hypothetical protein